MFGCFLLFQIPKIVPNKPSILCFEDSRNERVFNLDQKVLKIKDRSQSIEDNENRIYFLHFENFEYTLSVLNLKFWNLYNSITKKFSELCKDQKSYKISHFLQNKGTQNNSLPKVLGQNTRTLINKNEILEISRISISKI